MASSLTVGSAGSNRIRSAYSGNDELFNKKMNLREAVKLQGYILKILIYL